MTADVARVLAEVNGGWASVHAMNGVQMFGCDGGPACLTQFPASAANAWSAGWNSPVPASTVRVLREYAYTSNYWSRSSHDGRFVMHGGGASSTATIIDLERGVAIPSAGNYVPAFFPEGSGFLMPRNSGQPRLCPMGVVTQGPVSVTLQEPGCSQLNIGLQASLAVRDQALLLASGAYDADNVVADPALTAGPNSTLSIAGAVWTGSGFAAQPTRVVPTPKTGDHALSPTAHFAISRNEDAGYVLRALSTDGAGWDAGVVAEYCATGGVANFSFDERYVAYHHAVTASDWAQLGFTSPTDAAFVAMVGTTSNIYVLDLLTGASRPITRMSAGQSAKFPHFRADGWLYFVVRDANRAVEVLAASDAVRTF